MLKNYLLIGLLATILTVSLAFVLSIITSGFMDRESKITSTVDEEESHNKSKAAQSKDHDPSAPIKPNPEAMSSSANDQKKSDKVDKNSAHQYTQQHGDTPMPAHLETHTPVDLNEFLATREARRQRFAENYDKIINANPINIEGSVAKTATA